MKRKAELETSELANLETSRQNEFLNSQTSNSKIVKGVPMKRKAETSELETSVLGGEPNIVDVDAESLIDKIDFKKKMLKQNFKEKKTLMREPPKSLALNGDENPILVLKGFQNDGVRRMTFIERNWKGGILADDMGLGKTIQSIYLMAWDNTATLNLVICPLAVLDHWNKKIREFTTIKPLTYYGQNRKTLFRVWKKKYLENRNVNNSTPSIVLTTYDTLVSDDKNFNTILIKEDWNRIFIDEGHKIRNMKTKAFKTLIELKGKFKWVLSGTPVLNKIDDFITLMEWIGFYTHEKGCEYRKKLKGGSSGYGLLKDVREDARKIMIRRTKEDESVKQEIKLPQRNERFLVFPFYSKKEEEAYQKLYLRNRKKAKGMIGEGGGSTFFDLLQLIGHLRRFLDHPTLVNHPVFDYSDWKDIPTTKLHALFSLLIKYMKEDLENGVQRKYVIFSQWTSMLDEIQKFLQKIGFLFGRLDGQMSMNKREEELERFRTQNIPIFLVSLHAGGVGLDLSCANVAFVCDPWWNKGIENQAGDRLHRIGQTKDVEIIHLIVKGTMEEDILNLQQKKQTHVTSVLSPGNLPGNFKMEDIKMLFHFR